MKTFAVVKYRDYWEIHADGAVHERYEFEDTMISDLWELVRQAGICTVVYSDFQVPHHG